MPVARTNFLALGGLVTAAFSLACALQVAMPRGERDGEKFDLMQTLLGDSRRMFANHFFVKADAYFHSGFYPTIFDNRESFETAHMASDAGVVEEKNKGDEHGFLGQPLDLFDRFSRNFFPSVHTHMDEGGADKGHSDKGHAHDPAELKDGHFHGDGHDHGPDEAGKGVREILPWLKLSASLDPSRVDTYTTTAYWLRSRLAKSAEAEEFLREGLRLNPRNPAILFELARIYREDRKDAERARNLFEAGIVSWQKTEPAKKEPNVFLLHQLMSHLAQLEEDSDNDLRAIELWERVKVIAPNPAGPDLHLRDLREKIAKKPAK